MKKIILLLALGFFTFSATSLMAQTPKPTSVEVQDVNTTTTTTNTNTTNRPTRGCGIKPNRAIKNKPAKGQAGKVKGHGKCIRKGQKTGKGTKASTANRIQDRNKKCNQSNGKRTVKDVNNRIKKNYQRANS